MAQRARSLPDNVPGPFFVDGTCIDCGTCYEYQPLFFQDGNGHSRVHRQPQDPLERLGAQKALLACPTGSIGSDGPAGLREALMAFPDPVEDEVSFCGFTSEESFGAWSYFEERPGGNVLVDSPRAVPVLMDALERRGGVALMVLSHKDDVADHARFRERFHCARVMHRADLEGDTLGVERPLSGEAPVELAPDLLFLPTPGHTAGSACLLYRNRFLFTGDHLWWNPVRGMLSASRTYCWHDWTTQLASLERLLAYDFEWVLPGHGSALHAESPAAMRAELTSAIAYLRTVPG